jgi:D-alanyl-D-alanine carboxypeptidase/D-alanyl-D-alanine-endopeptidase (penicillin-binding protein 4)
MRGRRFAVLGILALFLIPGRSFGSSNKTAPTPSKSPAPAAGGAGKSSSLSKRRTISAPANTLEWALTNASRRPPAREEGISIMIADLETGLPVFQRNAKSPETIASVTKLFSTATAIHFLGPDYKFKTTFWRRGDVQPDGLLVGSLLVIGGGDPNISGRFYEDDYNAVFDKWAEGLARAGVRRISGNLVLNTSFFDSVGRHPEWPEGQEARWYQAPISALSFNDNVVVVAIRPGAKPGRPAVVSIEPDSEVVRPVSWAKTVSRGSARLDVRRSFGSGDVMVSGSVPSRGLWWSTPIAIDDPPAFFGSALRKRLQSAGIELLGNVVLEPTKPDNAFTLVADTESGLLPTLAVTNKRSQGFYAEQIFKTVAAEKFGLGNWNNAVAAEKEFLTAIGLEAVRYDIHDGSGLSPQNRVASEDVVAFLRAMNGHPYGGQWKATLALSGDPDGTLRHRLREASMRGRILAKTGSLRGVSTLAGYATAESGKTYVFAILLNGPGVWDTNGHRYQDRILRALVRQG